MSLTDESKGKKGAPGAKKLFGATGESAEVRDDLNSPDKLRVRTAIKKIIGMQTVGSDVSTLLADVVSGVAALCCCNHVSL